MVNFVNKLFGALGSNSLKKYNNFVDRVNRFENDIKELSDLELKNKTAFFMLKNLKLYLK